MATLTGQSIASSYEQLLHVDRDGGGNGTTLVNIKDGDNGTTFALQMATDKIQVNGNATITTADNSTQLSLISTDEDANVGPALELYRNSASPENSDLLGTIYFYGEDGADNKEEYARIESVAGAKGGGAEEGVLNFYTNNAGTLTNNRLAITGSETVINESSGNFDFRVESNNDANMLFVDAGNDKIGISNSSPQSKIHIDSTTAVPQLIIDQSTQQQVAGIRLRTNRGDTGTVDDNWDMYTSGGGDLRFAYKQEDNATYSNINVGFSNPVTFTSSGSVGIGSVAPDAWSYSNPVLTLSGGSTANNYVAFNLGAYSTSTTGIIGDINFTQFASDGTTGAERAIIRGLNDGATDSVALKFYTTATGGAVTERMVIKSDGNVGIGVSSGISAKLDVNGSAIVGRTRDIGSYASDDFDLMVTNGNNDATVLALYNDAGSFHTGLVQYYNSSLSIGLNNSNSDDSLLTSTAIVLDANSRISLSNNDSSGGGTTVFGYQSGGALVSGAINMTLYGYQAGNAITNGDNNTLIGKQSGYQGTYGLTTGNDNTALGSSSFGASAGANITGNYNTAIGSQAMTEAEGTVSSNTAVGYQALLNLTDGGSNTAIGTQAMGLGAVTGDNNVAIGTGAGYDIAAGHSNVIVGKDAGVSVDSGTENTIVGHQAGSSLQSGAVNTLVGLNAGGDVTGSSNTLIGANAGHSGSNDLVGANHCVFIGRETAGSSASASNQIVIGKGATGQADNSVTLGNEDVTAVYMAQDAGAKVHMGDFHLQNPTSFTFNDNASHELCSFESRYTDSPTGTTGAHIAFRQSADDFTSGTETARIANIGISGNINANHSSSLEFHVISGHTMTNLVTMGTTDAGNHVVFPQGKIRADKQNLNVTADFIGVQATYKKTDGASDNNDDLTALKAVVEFEDDTTIGDVKGAYIASQLNTSASGESGSIYGVDILAKQASYGSIDTNAVFGMNVFVDVDGNTVDGDVTGLYVKLDSSNPTGVQEAVYLDMNANADRFLRAFDSANSTARVLISSAGQIDAEGTINGTQSLDYAEYFESKDGKEIAVGTTVKLDGNKIVACSDGDTPIGAIRPIGSSCLVGGGQLFHWEKKYMKDDYGADIWEDYTITKWIEEVTSEIYLKRDKDETGGVHGGSLRYYKEEPVLYNEDDTLPSGKQIGDVKTGVKYFCEHQYHSDYLPKDISAPDNAETIKPNTQRQKLNPDFDISKTYESREERTEWHIVGLLGQIPITKGQPVASNWIKMKDVSDKVEMYFVK